MRHQSLAEIVQAACDDSACSEADRQRFLSALLPQPIAQEVAIDRFQTSGLVQSQEKHPVWLVARNGPQTVFYDEKSGLFGCCWGPDRDTGEYKDLGFCGGDPVAMFLL
jgi:hypothetical protein